MAHIEPNIAERIAQAASAYQKQRTGRAPSSVTVVLSDCTLVITLHHALSPAELALASTPEGAAQVQDFHRKLFAVDLKAFREEIQQIAGVHVREAIAEVEPETGAVVHAFTSGNMVQVFQLKTESPLATYRGTPVPHPAPDPALDRDPEPAQP